MFVTCSPSVGPSMQPPSADTAARTIVLALIETFVRRVVFEKNEFIGFLSAMPNELTVRAGID